MARQLKILLVDLPESSSVFPVGTIVSVGTYGKPYLAKGDDRWRPLRSSHNLPNFSEQDIIVINLDVRAEPEPVGDEMPIDVKPINGVVDPRPFAMRVFEDWADRIFANGGVFVVFAADANEQLYRTRKEGREVRHTTWEFVDLDEAVSSELDRGREIRPEDNVLGRLLNDHLADARFECKLSPHWRVKDELQVVARGKFGQRVAALLPPSKNRRGTVIIFPLVADMAGLVSDVVEHALPVLTPHLFDTPAAQSWVFSPRYELPSVVDLQRQIEAVRLAAESRTSELQEKIESERIAHGYRHSLLTETGPALVAAVIRGLKELGFTNVVDADAEDPGADFLREDLRIDQPGEDLILGEAKGIAGLPSDEDALQVWKYLAPRMKTLRRVDVRGLSIINHQRFKPPHERENDNVFRVDVVETAAANGVTLMTTWDLLTALVHMERLRWRTHNVTSMFRKDGRFTLVPAHYSHVGKIERVIQSSGVIGVTFNREIRIGDKLAIRAHVQYEEGVVQTLQIEGRDIETAPPGILVALTVSVGAGVIRIGDGVFLVAQ